MRPVPWRGLAKKGGLLFCLLNDSSVSVRRNSSECRALLLISGKAYENYLPELLDVLSGAG